MITFTERNGTALGPATPYDVIIPGTADIPLVSESDLRARVNQFPVVEAERHGARQIPILILRTAGSPAIDQWRLDVSGVFSPYAGYLTTKGTFNGVAVQAEAKVLSLTPSTQYLFAYEAILQFPDPIWQAVTATSGSGLSYTPAGNVDAQPVWTYTPGGSTAKRAALTVTDQSGRGLRDHLVVFGPFTSTGVSATTVNDYDLIIGGRRWPFYITDMNGTGTRVFAQVSVEPGGTLAGALYFGSSVNNLVTPQTLPLLGRKFSDATFSNTKHIWDDLSVAASNPNIPGVWRLARVANGGGLSFTTTTATVAVAGQSTDAGWDAVQLFTGSKIVSGETLTTAGLQTGDITWAVYRKNANGVVWLSTLASAFSQALTDAIHIAIGHQSVTGAFAMTGSTITIDFESTDTPVTTVGTPVNAQVGPFVLTNSTTGESLTIGTALGYAYLDDGATIAIDTATGALTPSAGNLFFDSYLLSNPDEGVVLRAGVANTLTVSSGDSLATSYRARFSV
jgi:hypothetical protein